jgi:hypothetical protein
LEEMKNIGRTVRFVPVRGDDGHDRSFITRDFNRARGKENGTIPFYRRFSDGRCQPDFVIGAGRNQGRGAFSGGKQWYGPAPDATLSLSCLLFLGATGDLAV